MAERKKKGKAVEEPNPLLDGLQFVSMTQAELGNPYETHSLIGYGFISAHNGIVGLGSPFEDTYMVAPHTKRLIDALTKVKGVLSLTTLPTLQMHIKDDKKFSALVPCVLPDVIQPFPPDHKGWPLNDEFRKAAEVAGLLTLDGATAVIHASLLTTDGGLIGTNGIAFIEARHGSPTPPGLVLPKVFFSMLAKINRKIDGFGFSNQSFTVWFEDGSYMRTQRYSEEWPDVGQAFTYMGQSSPVAKPSGLFEGIKAVASFSQEGRVYLVEDAVQSHPDNKTGATYKVPGLVGGTSFNSKFMLALEPYIETMDYTAPIPVMTFYGSNGDTVKLRGLLAKSQ